MPVCELSARLDRRISFLHRTPGDAIDMMPRLMACILGQLGGRGGHGEETMKIEAKSVDEYLAQLPEDRREMIEALREVILANIDEPFEEGMQYGMPGYYLPHSAYPAGYHCDPKQPLPFASIASQKNNVSLYLFCVYTDPKVEAWFREEWKRTGKRLDMGKSCVRVRRLEEIPLDLIGQLFRRVKAADFVAAYEAGRASGGGAGAKRKSVKRAAPKAGKKAERQRRSRS